MKILAIDPGTTQSAFVFYDFEAHKILTCGILDNFEMLERIRVMESEVSDFRLVIEMLKSYGNAMGDSCLRTCVWIGRFIQVYDFDAMCELIPRKTIVTEICRNPRARDANVRAALIDYTAERLSLPPEEVIGNKAKPGPLYHVKKDIWSALAVAVAWCEIKIK